MSSSGIVTTANPSYTAEELLFQINLVSKSYRIRALLVDPATLATAEEALRRASMPLDLIITTEVSTNAEYPTMDALIEEGATLSDYVRPSIDPMKKIAFLSFSSG
jgi:4-coumarate--CoA ligase